MDIVGFAHINKNATTCKGAENPNEFIGQTCAVMEFDSAGGVFVLNPQGTALAMFDKEDIYRKFECTYHGGVVCPPNLAPVPFSSLFTFTEEIKTYLKSRNLTLDEYNVEINNNTLYKRYENTFTDEKGNVSNLIGVDFVDIRNDNQELISTCWYGYREQSNIVLAESTIERGLRIRTKNISIGNEFTCNRFFDQERTNLRFIGEIHTLNDGFIPNARRDYFTENATYQQFEKNLKEILKAENLENRLAQTASKLHNRLKEIQKYKETYQEFVEKKGSFENAAAESFHLNRLREQEEKATKAIIEIEKIKAKSSSSENVKKLFNSIIGNENLSVKNLTGEDLQISKYTPPTFEKLNEEQRTVVLEIFEILEEELDFDISELIKKRIVEKYNRDAN